MKPRRVKMSPNMDSPVEPASADIPRAAPIPQWPMRVFLATVTALVVTYVVTAIALDLLVDSERVRSWIEPRASAALNRRVTVGEARIDLVPRPSLRLTDIAVDNRGGFEGPALASLEEVRLDVSWLQLAIGRVVVQQMHFERPRVNLAIAENGVSNFGDLVPTKGAAADRPASPFVAALRRVTVSQGTLSFFDASRDRSFMVTDGEGSADIATGAEGEWLADVVVDTDSLLVRMPSVNEEILRSVGPTASLVLVGDRPLSSLGLDGGFVALAGDTLLVRGRVAGLDGDRPSFDVRFTNDRLSTRALEAVFSPEQRSRLLPRAEGALALTVQVQGGLRGGDRPLVRGVARLDAVALRLRGELVADGVDGLVQFGSDGIQIQTLRGLFAGGPFQLAGTVARDERLTTALTAEGRADLDALDRLEVLPEALTLSGNGAFDLVLTGSLRSLDSLEAVGALTLDGAHVEHDRLGAPVYVPAGIVTVDGRAFRWNDLGAIVGTHPLITSGEIEDVAAFRADAGAPPRLHLAVTGGHLDLNVFFPPRTESSTTYTELALAHIGGRTLDGRSSRSLAREAELSRPARAAVTGTVLLEVDTLTYRAYRLEGVSTVVTLSDSAVSIPEASFSVWGGEGRGTLDLELGSEPAERFALSLTLEGVSSSSFFTHVAPAGGGITGTLDVDVQAEGFTDDLMLPQGDSLAGHLRLALREGRISGMGVNHALADFLEASQWSEVPFDTWTTDLEVRERLALLEHSDLSGPFGRIVFGGSIDLGGSSDVSVAMSLPASQLGVVSLRRTGIGPGVVAQLRASGRALDLGLRMSGPFDAPSLEPDAANAVALARR